jgi:hypothetical protein
MDGLLDVARIVLAGTDLGVRCVQRTDNRVGVEVWQARNLSATVGLFSEQVGSVLGAEYSEQWPTVTRVVVGAGDEGTARMFRLYVDSAVESGWVRVVERFQDRRDVNPADATAETEVAEAGAATLAEGGPGESFRLQVSETAGLRYGADFRVGDMVSAYPGGVRVTDRVTEATVTVDQGGESLSVWVGRKDDDPDERMERQARDVRQRMAHLEGSM